MPCSRLPRCPRPPPRRVAEVEFVHSPTPPCACARTPSPRPHRPSPFRNCDASCSKPALAGDGYCDDGNNNCGCDWDNGDCCKATIGASYNYCSKCLCMDPLSPQYVGGSGEPPTIPATPEPITQPDFEPPTVPVQPGGATPPPDAVPVP